MIPQAKEPVKLRYKKLKNGNTSLYLDIYSEGRRHYDFLHLYLTPELTAKDRVKNQQTLALTNTIMAQRIVELQSGAHGFTDKKTRTLLRFVDYLRAEADRYRAKGSRMYAQSVINSVNHLVDGQSVGSSSAAVWLRQRELHEFLGRDYHCLRVCRTCCT